MKSRVSWIFLAGLVASAGAARADCTGATPEFDSGYCQTKTFMEADQSLNQVYRDLLPRLTEADGTVLKHEEITWLKQRNALCTIQKSDRTYVDFGCATTMTKQRLAKLRTQLAALAPASTAKGVGTHGCAVFGGMSAGVCQDFPDWTVGTWQPPDGAATVRALIVGGGGGGAASIERGIGGTGGSSGKVVVITVATAKTTIRIEIGAKGIGGLGFRHPGSDGGPSSFGGVTAPGGGGGQPYGGGRTPVGDGGSNGGGGGGGGNYQQGFHAGMGGAGGTGGTEGGTGEPGTDAQNPVKGTEGGVGSLFPQLNFAAAAITAGAGGMGGLPGHDGRGFGGGGGGGGGGILVKLTGARAGDGMGGPEPFSRTPVGGGAGGAGYGAGGGGGGNFAVGARGGDGAPGLVYVEW